MPDLNLIESYDYELPEELIAQTPVEQRDHSRLMVLDRETGDIEHRQFCDLLEYLRPHDCLVLNQTRVVPARLRGVRDRTGGKWEGLFLSLHADGSWEMMSKSRGKLQPGETVTVHAESPRSESPQQSVDDEAGVQLELIEKKEGGCWKARPVVELSDEKSVWELLDRIGSVPLPPYIRHGQAKPEDARRYQSVYARIPGAAAAPTAGLHFSEQLLQKCQQARVSIAYLTLHVGLGTFRPVSVSRLDKHEMHSEWCEIDATAVNTIQASKEQGGRIIAVGTTSMRTLESAARYADKKEVETLKPWRGHSDLFIRPGFQFHVVDGLITNYHLPKSTLLVLLCTFAGYEQVMNAYQIAIQQRYRFFSYGDAMLVLPGIK